MNPFLKRNASKTKHGSSSEKRLAKKLGFQVSAASGALDGAKGDSKSRDFLCESKSTVYESITLKREWLEKIAKHALLTKRKPIVTLSFVSGSGMVKRNGDFVVLRLADFEDLMEKL